MANELHEKRATSISLFRLSLRVLDIHTHNSYKRIQYRDDNLFYKAQILHTSSYYIKTQRDYLIVFN